MTDLTLDNADAGDASAVDSPSRVPTGHYFVRFGTFFLTDKDDSKSFEEVHHAVMTALASDSRVQTVRTRPLRPHWSYHTTVYPCGRDIAVDDVLSGNDQRSAVQFSDLALIEIRVPAKNQPLFNGEDDVPTDHYWVAWDGVTAVVLWEAEEESVFPARSAGHVIEGILSSAAERAGFELMQQACSVDCHNMFTHRDIRVFQYAGDAGLVGGFDTGESESEPALAYVESNAGADKVLKEVAYSILATGDDFAVFKNYARRLSAIEGLSQVFVTDLLVRDYAEIVRRRQNFWSRTGTRVAAAFGRKSSRKATELIASLWLLMASKEALVRQCTTRRRSYSQTASRMDTDALFASDSREDEHAVDTLDLSFIRAAIEQKSSRLDSKIVAIATGMTALAAVVGALIGKSWI